MKNLKDFIDNNQLSISYLGRADDRITTQLIGLTSSYIGKSAELKKISKKVYLLIAESFQNVIRHGTLQSNTDELSAESDYFQIDFLDDRILLSSKNMIEVEHVQELSDKIEMINTLSDKELKEMWVKCMTIGKMSEKGGAGLGIIEMARKSHLPLQKRFITKDDSHSQFFLGIEILGSQAGTSPKLDIDKIISQYSNFLKEGHLLKYRGAFSGDTNPMIIEMLHNNFVDESRLDSKTIENVTIMIEAVQNISKHSDPYKGKHNGEFSIFEKEGILQIECINFVAAENYAHFNSILEDVKSKSIEELKQDRKIKMIQASLNAQGDGGLGLLEMAIFTNNEFKYSLNKVDDDYYIFFLNIKMK